MVQAEEAILAGCTGLATHTSLAETLPVALERNQKRDAVGRSPNTLDLSDPNPIPRHRLTNWHSVTPPRVPRGSQLQPGEGRVGVRALGHGMASVYPSNP